MSDEQSRNFIGATGNEHVMTPNLDALCEKGVMFSNAYCNSPICVPSRASFHTGYYPHEIGYWDNAMPYEGRVSSWGHALQDAGRTVVSVGKLHFRDAACETGFDQQILPLHVKDGIGDPSTLLRKNPVPRPDTRQMADMAGKGVTPYWNYDVSVADAAARWLGEKGGGEAGWTLFVSFVLPHFPLNAPSEFRALYDREKLPLPKAIQSYEAENESVAEMRALLNFQDGFTSLDIVREAVANYFALCTALDHNVGKVLDALQKSGLDANTTVIYTSDHGDNLGARGYWGKSTLWEESVGIPLVMSGPNIPEGQTNTTAVSLIDVYPTVCDLNGIEPGDARPGKSLMDVINTPDTNRPVFAEYHAVGSKTGGFMLRTGRWKLIEFVGDRPLLYDLQTDPEELNNLAADLKYSDVLARCRQILSEFVDPEAANEQAFVDQASMVEKLGGEERIRTIKPLAFTPPC